MGWAVGPKQSLLIALSINKEISPNNLLHFNVLYLCKVFESCIYSLTFDTWIRGYLKRADQNQDGKMSYDEVKRLLQMINIDLSEHYARCLFKVRVDP